MLDQNAIQNATDHLHTLQNEADISVFEEKYLGNQGLLSLGLKMLKDMSPEEKKIYGGLYGTTKKLRTDYIDRIRVSIADQHITTKLSKELRDDSLTLTLSHGSLSLLTREKNRIEDLCLAMGFDLVHGHELVTQYENFEAVNIPKTHPATEMHDTIFSRSKDTDGNHCVMRTHTSALQNLVMHTKGQQMPIKVAIPGRAYRFEKMDASHDTMFYQLEGIYIDTNVSIGQCKSFLTTLLTEIFEKETTIRMRPGYFPFVEPGFEIDARCPICTGSGCSLCKQVGWIEILGAGMIHPKVLQEGGLDTTIYNGFAFGMGINRLLAIKHHIPDIRYLTNGDLRSAQSFAGY